MKSSKQLWIVSELFYPETISTGYIMTEIAKSLSKDFDVSVISGPIFYEKKELKKEIKPLQNIQINRIKSNGYNKNNFLSRMIGHIKVTIKMFLLMRKSIPNNSEILMVTNPVLLIVLTSLLIKKKQWKIKLFIHDVFPENLVISGILKSNKSSLFRFLQHIFNKAFKKMNTIIVCGRDMQVVFQNKLGENKNIEIIENWADVKNIKSNDIINTDKNILFAGNFGRVQGLKTILNIIKDIDFKGGKVTFIGSGALEHYIEEFIEQNKIDHIEKFGWKNREEQDKFLSESNVGLITLEKGMYGIGVPSKLYNLLAAGRPIFYIGDLNSEIHLVLKENRVGWFAEAGNEVMIKNTFLEIIDSDISLLKEFSRNSRELAEKLYSKEIILNKINLLFEK